MLKTIFPFSLQEENVQNGSLSQQHATAATARLSQASVISYASHFSRSTSRRDSEASSIDSKACIKDFFKDMMRKLCPDRPRYFNRPLEDKHDCNDEVGLVEDYLTNLYK